MNFQTKIINLLFVLFLGSLASGREYTPSCGDCKDSSDFCHQDSVNSLCDDKSFQGKFIKEKCALTCGECKLCPDTLAPRFCGSEPCEDNNKRCRIFSIFGFCKRGPWALLVQKKCKKSCGACKPSNCELPFPPSFPF